MRRRRPAITLSAGAVLIGIASSCVRAPDAITDADRLPGLVVEEQLRIGSIDDPDAGFSQIWAVAVADDGRVYVLERQDRHIRVYDAAGGLLRVLGREGSGPGEFRSPFAMGIVGDTVWVRDSMLRRITLFRREGELIATLTSPPVPVEAIPGVLLTLSLGALRRDHYFDGSPSFAVRADPPADSFWLPHVRMTAEGEIVDTLRLQRWAFPAVRRISFDGRQLTVPPPPSSAPLELALEDELYVVRRPVADDAARGEFTVTRTDAGGDTIFHRSFHYHPRPIDAAFVDSLIFPQARAYARSAGIDADVVAASFRDAIELPGFLPPISSGRVMADSSLWLTREYDAVAGARWIVLEPDGAVRGTLELPRTATVYWSRGDILWTVVRDELDVQWLVKYRMRPGARD